MKLILAMACVTALCTAVGAAQTPSAPSGSQAPTAPPSSTPSGSDPIAPAGHWNVAQAPCRAILSASDDDRAAIAMFYYGYLAAQLNRNIIDTSRIEGDLRHVFETCHQHPDITIVAAFETLRGRSTNDRTKIR